MGQIEITHEQFDAYDTVRQSGLTNMFNVNEVIKLAEEICGVELTREMVLHIMHNYTSLLTQFGN